MTQTHRILVVDDNPEVRKAHERLVRALGYEVETASDGIEALAMLSLGIDMMLLDGEMPNMDGFEVAQRVRENPELTHLPIVMVTGTKPEDRRRALEIGINDFLNKPVDAQDLALKAKWLLQPKAAYDRLKDHEAELTRAVEARTQALRTALTRMTEAERLTQEAHLDTIRTVGADPPCGAHARRGQAPGSRPGAAQAGQAHGGRVATHARAHDHGRADPLGLERQSGAHFDPAVLDVFVANLDHIVDIQRTHRGAGA